MYFLLWRGKIGFIINKNMSSSDVVSILDCIKFISFTIFWLLSINPFSIICLSYFSIVLMSKVDALVLLITEMNYVLMLYQYLPRYLELKKAKSLYCTATVSPLIEIPLVIRC